MLTVFIIAESKRLKPQMIAATTALTPSIVSSIVRFSKLMR